MTTTACVVAHKRICLALCSAGVDPFFSGRRRRHVSFRTENAARAAGAVATPA